MSRRRTLRAATSSFLAVAALIAFSPGASALGSTPSATIGGPGHAGMYPSGMEIVPTTAATTGAGIAGNVIVADTGNSKIKAFTPAGAALWTAGTTPGAGIAQFNDPRDIAVDTNGNIYVADTGNNRVIKLSPTGTSPVVIKGDATLGMIVSPMGLTFSNNKLYVADAGTKKVRVFNAAGTQLGAYGSVGACVLSQFRDVDADSSGVMYLANYTTKNIVKLSATGACLGSFNDGGTFKNPYGVRIFTDPVRNIEAVYVADSNNNQIKEFDLNGTRLEVFGSLGDHTQPGTFGGLRRVAVAADGDVWGADLWGYRVERFNQLAGGNYVYAQTIGATPPPLTNTAVFNDVKNVAFDAAGTIYAMDSVNQRVVLFNSAGQLTGAQACGERGWTSGAFNWPRGIAVDPGPSGNPVTQLWVADTKQSRLQIIKPNCAFVRIIGGAGATPGKFNWPYDIAIRASDRIAFVADTKNHRIQSYNVASRALITTYGTRGAGNTQLNEPRGLTVDPTNGHLLIADAKNNRIVEVSDTGGNNFAFVRVVATGFKLPEGVAADANRIYVADTGNNKVVILDRAGAVVQTLTGFKSPCCVAIDGAGRLLVSDSFNDVIKVFT